MAQDPWQKKQAAAQRRTELRERAVAHLGGKCNLCGYSECLAAFDFHHVNPLEKDFNISAKMTSWEAIEKELKKVELLCCRCHREVHDGRHPGHIEFDERNVGGDEHQLDLYDPLPEMLDAEATG